MRKLYVTNPPFVFVQRNRRAANKYDIAICKLLETAQFRLYTQKRTTLKTIDALDYFEAYAYALKWFGITDDRYNADE